MTQGKEANTGGAFLRDAVRDQFRAYGVACFSYAEKRENADLFLPRFLLSEVPYTSIYGCQCRSDLLYTDAQYGNIRIECKWQQSQGSVDEKFPYLLENAKRWPEREIWFVVDGGGFREAGLTWFKRECSRVELKTIYVVNIPEVRSLIKKVTSSRAA